MRNFRKFQVGIKKSITNCSSVNLNLKGKSRKFKHDKFWGAKPLITYHVQVSNFYVFKFKFILEQFVMLVLNTNWNLRIIRKYLESSLSRNKPQKCVQIWNAAICRAWIRQSSKFWQIRPFQNWTGYWKIMIAYDSAQIRNITFLLEKYNLWFWTLFWKRFPGPNSIIFWRIKHWWIPEDLYFYDTLQKSVLLSFSTDQT